MNSRRMRESTTLAMERSVPGVAAVCIALRRTPAPFHILELSV
jgi:hypothetical protein